MNREKKLLLRVADTGFHIQWTNPPMAELTDHCYKGFIYNHGIKQAVSNLKQTTTIHVRCIEPPDKILTARGLKKILSVPNLWSLYKNRSHYIMQMFHPAQDRPLSVARITDDFKDIDYYFLGPDYKGLRIDMRDTRDYWLLPRVINPLVKCLLINSLAKQGGCLIHGSGVKIKNLGLAFVGKSGSGKSTLAKFFRRFKDTAVLTDENLAVSRKGNKFYIYGTPWPGGARVANAESAPLKHIFFIKHGKVNLIKPVSAKEAFKKLIAQAMLCAWDKPLVDSAVNFIRDLSSAIGFFDLEFVNDKGIVPFLRNRLKKGGEK